MNRSLVASAIVLSLFAGAAFTAGCGFAGPSDQPWVVPSWNESVLPTNTVAAAVPDKVASRNASNAVPWQRIMIGGS